MASTTIPPITTASGNPQNAVAAIEASSDALRLNWVPSVPRETTCYKKFVSVNVGLHIIEVVKNKGSHKFMFFTDISIIEEECGKKKENNSR
ncbi:MAG: hypothetical protein MUE38_13050 [Flavihumibacter sp.]|nr:hypothetical protein [Flavihumibacter sp.]